MITNEGTADRLGRLVLPAAALLLSWWVGFGSLGGILLLVLAAVMLVTAAVGFCPTYRLLEISTRPSDLNVEGRGRNAPLAFRILVES